MPGTGFGLDSAVRAFCAQCKTDVNLGDARCSACGSSNIMIGVTTPDGKSMSASRDWPRMLVHVRRLPGSDELQHSVTVARAAITHHASRRSEIAPHVRIYNEVRWSHDRQRLERREMYIDSDNDYYRQVWYSLQTGEVTWGPKEGKLSDPDMHGRSARRG